MHLVVDLETMNTDNDAIILQIGGALFGTKPFEVIGEFNVAVSGADCLAHGMTLSWDTLRFWFDQRHDLAENVLFNTTAVPLRMALELFSSWYKAMNDRYHISELWSRGPAFDIAILQDAYQRLGMATPWGYRVPSCERTLYRRAEHHGWEQPPRTDNQVHDALADARHQAKCVASAVTFLNDLVRVPPVENPVP